MKQYLPFDFVNTSESYSDKILFDGDTLIIPNINIQLMEGNPLNNISCFIDYSICIFRGVEMINARSNNLTLSIESSLKYENLETEYIYYNKFDNNKGYEIEIKSRDIKLYIFDYSKVSFEKMFIPIHTPFFSPNMKIQDVNDFFSEKFLTEEIRQELSKNYYFINIQ
jgi:hypothetical protein